MTLEQIREKGKEIWIMDNPSEHINWNPHLNNFVEGFVEGFKFAMNNVENQLEENFGD